MSGGSPRESPYPPRGHDRDRNAEGRAENARPRDRFGRPLPRDAAGETVRSVPAEVVGSIDEALDWAVSLFDQQRFFEAHEFLEWIWKAEDVPGFDRAFWKGVTQVAVGFTHTQRGNAKGARTLLERARSYLAPYPSPYHGIDTAALSAGAAQVIAAVADAGPSPDIDFPRFPRVR